MIDFNSQESYAMRQNKLLIENIDRLHTTPMGADRIKRNLKLDTDDVVGYPSVFGRLTTNGMNIG